jgi:tRNA/tmRNA/rRNA uracil-C5-methylase (TrmA/RlmC/RlmD family)
MGYRNRIRVHVATEEGALRIGFYAKRGRQIVDVHCCPIASANVNERLAALRRAQPRPGEYTLSARPEVVFFEQTNDGAAAELVRVVTSLVGSGRELLVDAYCGAGFFGSLLAHHFERVAGIESHPEAIAAAQKKAAYNETYTCGDVSVHLSQILAGANPRRTTVLLDPPAAGLSTQVTEILRRTPVGCLVYVSCDPATLARDLGALVGFGYRLETVVPVDMFPQTADIEVVASLSFGE